MLKFASNFARVVKTYCSPRYAIIGNPSKYAAGSANWLIATEKHFGGLHTNVRRCRVSPHDPRTPAQIMSDGMTGGDRMYHHGYAEAYSVHLRPFLSRRNERLTIVEIGILKGTGLALWSALFPNANIIGLDIDLSHTERNLDFLKSRGAFASQAPELHIFDQFEDGSSRIAEILHGRKIDICIDDGYHSRRTIIKTAEAVFPHCAPQFVYFVEDNSRVAKALAKRVPVRVENIGRLTVLGPSAPSRRILA